MLNIVIFSDIITSRKAVIIMLDKKSVQVLKYIKNNPNKTANKISAAFGENVSVYINGLLKDEYITRPEIYSPYDGTGYINVYTISSKGIAYLENRPKKALRFWVPMIISYLISIAALIVSIVK
jgi:hypothetical protein